MKTILVPVDLSTVTTRVCDAAAAFAQLISARVVLLHVVLPQPVRPGDFFAFDAGAVMAAAVAEEKWADRRLRTLAKRYTSKKIPVQTLQSTGQPAGEILNHATATKADYIVLGSHGHGAAYDLLVGSVAQGVLRRAPCPVLVIPIKRR